MHEKTAAPSSVRAYCQKFLEEQLDLPIIEHPYRYIQSIRLARQQQLSLHTQDGLGVITPLPLQQTHIPFRVQRNAKLDLTALDVYLSNAPIPSHYALFRDIQLHYVLDEEPALKNWLVASMKGIGLLDEAARLARCE